MATQLKITRQQKILGAILVSALGLLVWDQIHTPAISAASVPATPDAPKTDLAVAPGSIGGVVNRALATKSVAERLADLSPTPIKASDMHDGFAPIDATAVTMTAETGERHFNHRMTGVMLTGANRFAVIDGRAMRVGDRLDGYRLIAIERNFAIFESHNQRITVPLAD